MPPPRRAAPTGEPLTALILGRGLLAHPANAGLRERLGSVPDAGERFYPQVLAVLLRLQFRSLAGHRGLLPAPPVGGWAGAILADLLGPSAAPDLDGCGLADADLRDAVAALPPVAAAADLGALYQELLGLYPVVDVRARTFDLVSGVGDRRKTTGSYCTPPELVDCLLDTALEPVLEEALSRPDPAAALRSLRICDPACGDGRFLVAAGRRLAALFPPSRLPLAAMREVVGRCLYGVDRDPLAIELCKFALWLECDKPGVPVAFLDRRVRCGNSLVGATPAHSGDLDPDAWTAAQMGAEGPGEVERLRARHGFFHWHREFPDVFSQDGAGQSGGFDVVLGNPPWERVKLLEREWFAARCPAVSAAPGAAARRQLVDALRDERPELYAAFEQARRAADAEARFLLGSGRYPLSGRGDVNTYGPFVETARLLLAPGGRAGLVVPSGIATDDTLKDLFRSLLAGGALTHFYDFHNRGGHFPGVQGNVKFCLLTLSDRPQAHFTAAAQLDGPAGLAEPGRTYRLSAGQVARLNPNTRHAPTFAGARDADLVARLHERLPVLVREGEAPDNPWGVRPWTMFHMTKDAPLFRSLESLAAGGWVLSGNVFRRGAERYLPLVEAKLVRSFNHRAATFAGVAAAVRFRTHARTRPAAPGELADPHFAALPRYWVPEEAVAARAGPAGWFLGFRNAISAVADARSLVAAVVPRAGVGNSLPLVSGVDARRACLLLGLLNSFVLDYVLRQKASGGNLNFHVLKQLPVPPPAAFDAACPWSPREALADWFAGRVRELVCTSSALGGFARACGHVGPPFAWDEPRRRLLRAELDAACFHLYGLGRADAEYVLSTFVIAERGEVREHGRRLSREAVLECYDRLGGSG